MLKMAKLKNLFILILVKFINLFTKINEVRFRNLKILVLSTTGLGDTLWATPFLEEIKKYYPTAEICFFTTSLGHELLKNNPHIDTFVIFQIRKLFSLIKKLKKLKIQIVFHLHTSQRLFLPIASIIGAQKIVGYKGKTKGLDKLLSDVFLDTFTHQIEKRLKLLKILKISASISAPKYYFSPKDPIIKKLNEINILIHPGAKDRYKLWPFSYYIELAKMYQQTYQAKIFFSFGPSDGQIKKLFHQYNEFFCILENLPISIYAKLISSMHLMVTNDTGTMHLAAATGIPTIGIFSVTDPKVCGPIGENTTVVYRKKTCSPCLNRKCFEPFCFYQINPTHIFKVSEKFLN
jgi:ADP-heptose:LPS heptosyltransferase